MTPKSEVTEEKKDSIDPEKKMTYFETQNFKLSEEQEGEGMKSNAMHLLWPPLVGWHRPLVFDLCIHLVSAGGNVYTFAYKARCHRSSKWIANAFRGLVW